MAKKQIFSFCPGISNTGGLVPPCAPDELSNNRFWDALNGRAWFNNATLFGHVDFLDPGATVDVIDVSRKPFLRALLSKSSLFPSFSFCIFAHPIRKMKLIFYSVLLLEVKQSRYLRDCSENVIISCIYQRKNECLQEYKSENKMRKNCVPLQDVFITVNDHQIY